MKHRIYLIRHGQYQHQLPPTSPSLHLTQLGRAQALLAAERMRNFRISHIYSSDLPRAVETTQIIASVLPSIPIRYSRLLRECIPSIPAEFEEQLQLSEKERRLHARQVQRAFQIFFRPSNAPQPSVSLIICHGNIIRAFACMAMRVPMDTWVRTDVCNASISEFEVSSSGDVRLNSLNDSGHIPPAIQTYM